MSGSPSGYCAVVPLAEPRIPPSPPPAPCACRGSFEYSFHICRIRQNLDPYATNDLCLSAIGLRILAPAVDREDVSMEQARDLPCALIRHSEGVAGHSIFNLSPCTNLAPDKSTPAFNSALILSLSGTRCSGMILSYSGGNEPVISTAGGFFTILALKVPSFALISEIPSSFILAKRYARRPSFF